MTYAIDEQSVNDSRPIELFRFTSPSQTWYLTTFNRRVSFLGHTYQPVAGFARSAQIIPTTETSDTLTFMIPYEHELAQRCLRPQPPREIVVDVFRYQSTSTEYRQLWSGVVASADVSERICNIRVPSFISDGLDTPLPGWLCSRQCSHLLFSSGCGVARLPHYFGTTVASASGRIITLSSSLVPATADWFLLGEVIHDVSTERRRIVAHGSTTVTLDYEFFGSVVGANVSVYPGCDHTLKGTHGCKNKFSNVVNFGGHPHNSTSNPFELGLNASKKD